MEVSGPIADNAKSEVPAQVETTEVVVEAVVTEEVVAEASEPASNDAVAEVPAQDVTADVAVEAEAPAETPAE